MMEPLRASIRRWHRLSVLLASVERSMVANAKLDAWATPSAKIGEDHEALMAFNTRLIDLTKQIEHEMDVLTSELLRVDLARRRAQQAA